MRRTFSWFSILAFVFAMSLGAVVGGVAVAQSQNHMRNARADLQAAWNQLNVATHDKAGHRANAMNLVSQAINQVNLGIAAGSY
jgi:hypothetical protein